MTLIGRGRARNTPARPVPATPRSLAASSLNSANGLSTVSAYVAVAAIRRAPTDRWNKLFHLDCQVIVDNGSGEYKVLMALGAFFNRDGMDLAAMFAHERPYPVFQLDGTLAKLDPSHSLHEPVYHVAIDVTSLKPVGHYDPDFDAFHDEEAAEDGDGGGEEQVEDDDVGSDVPGTGLDHEASEHTSHDFSGYNMLSIQELAASVTTIFVGMAYQPNPDTQSFLMDIQLYLPDGFHRKAVDATGQPATPSPSADSSAALASFKPLAPVCCTWPSDKSFKKNPPLPHTGRYVACLGTLYDFSVERGDNVELARLNSRILQLAYLGATTEKNAGRIVPNTLDSPVAPSGAPKSIFNLGARSAQGVAPPPPATASAAASSSDTASTSGPAAPKRRGRPPGSVSTARKKSKVSGEQLSDKSAGKKPAIEPAAPGADDAA
ncbi:hypothetical protein BKA70DRAFT_1449659 [Coprinopsis sp. MPI-PUGE-AT-0042]|nr:hypothetical protein BKA70DRAFT_1449659 [Coprinopsis sp. MPI-PUGE-AT-0042]